MVLTIDYKTYSLKEILPNETAGKKCLFMGIQWYELIEIKVNEYHECKYCGAVTNQPDAECYKAPVVIYGEPLRHTVK